jgi:hypothetical protein
MILDGKTDYAIAKQVGVTPSAVTRFRARHADEITQAVAQVERDITEYAIAQKVSRIAALDNRWTLAHQVILARANDPTFAWAPGYSTGLLVRDVKAVGSGEGVDLVDVFKVDSALLAELRAMERAAAEELAQLPKSDINIDARTQVLIRTYRGLDPDEIG